MPFDVLEPVLLQTLREMDEFYFVQIGASGSVMHDALSPLIRKYGLRGCLIEPMADVFEVLQRNYRDQPQLDFRNVMIGDHDCVAEIHRFTRDAPAPYEVFHGLSRRKRARTEAVQCKIVTFESFMADLPVRNISMLYVDTEGSDDMIIEAAFRAGVFPPIINYEWSEMPLERRCALKMRLLDHGYRFIDVGSDTVCLRVEQALPDE